MARLRWIGLQVIVPAMVAVVAASFVTSGGVADRTDPAPGTAFPRPDGRSRPWPARPLLLTPVPSIRTHPNADAESAPLDPIERLEIQREQTYENVIAPFEREPGRDPTWAPAMEEQLGDEFDRYVDQYEADGVRLDSIECRTRRCRVELRYDDPSLIASTNDRLFSHTVFNPHGCTIASLGLPDPGGVQTIHVNCSEGAVRVSVIPLPE